MTKEKAAFSLDDLDATRASAEAFEFEYLMPDGEPSGLFLSVLGGQSEQVTREVARIINERRRRDAVRAAKRKKDSVEFDTFESDLETGSQLAFVRLVGWRGMVEEFNEANAMRLCSSNRDVAAQIIEQSDLMANFMKR